MWRAAFLAILAFIPGCEALKEPDPNMVVRPEIIEKTDSRILIPRIKEMRVDKTGTGILIFATGEAVSYGHSQAELVPVNEEKPEDGILVYEFRVMAPEQQQSANSLGASEPLVARVVSNTQLSYVNGIKVIGKQNTKFVALEKNNP